MNISPQARKAHDRYYFYRRPKGALELPDFARVFELTREGLHTPRDISRMVPGTRENQVARIARRTKGATSNARGLIRDVELPKKYFYMRRIANMTIKEACAELGIANATGVRWDGRMLSRNVIKNLRSRNTSRGLADPKRELMRQMLGMRDPEGGFRFSVSMVAKVFDLDKTAALSANNAHPRIRSPEELSVGQNQFKNLPREKYLSLLAEAQALAYQLLSRKKPTHKLKNLMKLTPEERKYLERRSQGEIDFMEANGIAGDGNVGEKIRIAKAIVTEVFRNSWLYMTKDELCSKLGVKEDDVYRALEILGEKRGIGIIRNIRGVFAISPEMAHYLQKG